MKKQRKPLKSKRTTANPSKAQQTIKRHKLFQQIWRQRPHRSEISGTPLGREALSTFFHHILPKSKFPMADLDPENIIMLTPDEHANVESDMFRYDEVNERREQLLRKYNLI